MSYTLHFHWFKRIKKT